MRKNLTIIFTALSVLMILDSLEVAQTLAMFFLAGQIPGTHFYISATAMLEFYALALGFVISRLTIHAFSALRSRRPVAAQA